MSKLSKVESRQSEIVDSDDESAYKKRWRRSKPKFRPTLWDRYCDSWYPEVAATCLSTVCGIAIIAVLVASHQRPPPSLHYGLTLNAVISILATTAKVSMIFCISSALGQLKWIWFNDNKSRQLLDASIFDEASRGPWGSMRLLSTHVAWSLAAVGSALTVLALGFDPFVQQVVTYPKVLHRVSSDQCVAPVAKALIGMPQASVSDVAIETGIFGDLDFRISPTCPSGNCTFRNVPSIGWCAQCAADPSWSLTGNCNLTVTMDELTEEGGGILHRNCMATSSKGRPDVPFSLDIAYPDRANFSTSGQLGLLHMSWLTDRILTTSSISDYVEHNSSLTNIPPDQPVLEITSFKTLPNTNNEQLPLDVQKCSLDLCVIYSDANVNSYTVQSNVTHAVNGSKTIQTGARKDVPYSKFLCWAPNGGAAFDVAKSTEFDSGSANIFSSQNYSFCGAQNSSTSWFKSWATELEGKVTGNTTSAFLRQVRVRQDQLVNGQLAPLRQETSYTGTIMQARESLELQDILNKISTSLNLLALGQSTSWNVTGVMETWPTIVHVRGWWLLVPFILYAGTISFLSAVIYLNSISKAPLWKSFINVLFYHGLDHDMGLHSSMATVPEMEARSTQMNARLVPFGRHERLVLETTMIQRATWTSC